MACRIAWNHPLPDGNKRAAWACLVLFIDLNGGLWTTMQPDVMKPLTGNHALPAQMRRLSARYRSLAMPSRQS